MRWRAIPDSPIRHVQRERYSNAGRAPHLLPDRNMSLDRVPAGKDIPSDCNVVIEIPMHGDPIKYEVDKETGAGFEHRC
jgi:hypothetical protein